MARILAIDYGKKRTGIAVTDPGQIIVTPLTTIPTAELLPFLKSYFSREEVERVVLGEPRLLDGSPAQMHPKVLAFAAFFKKQFPDMPLELENEVLSSEEAKTTVFLSGAKKKKRRQKGILDKVAAAIILERYLERIGKY